MKLNDNHIAILEKVRAQMQKDAEEDRTHERSFICWHIWFVQSGELELPNECDSFRDLVAFEGTAETCELIAAINKAIFRESVRGEGGYIEKIGSDDPNYAFHSWIYYNMREAKVVAVSGNYSTNYSTWGRLAWLDRMIETRVIA